MTIKYLLIIPYLAYKYKMLKFSKGHNYKKKLKVFQK